MRRLVPIVVALAVAAAGCGGQRNAAVERSPWTPIGGTLSGAVDPRSANICNRGGIRCIDAVVAEMVRRFAPLARDCDHRAAFALMYLRVTQAVGQEEKHGALLADRAYLSHLDALFARLYFTAADDWALGRHGEVPRAWQIAFEAAQQRRASGIGDLLLGMNAHISRDLPFAVASIGFRPGGGGASEERAFGQVNQLLTAVQDSILREESRRFDPTIGTFTLPVLKVDAASVALLIDKWRDAALRDGLRLLRARTSAHRAAVVQSIEDNATARAAIIFAATSRVPFSKAGKARDRFCNH